MPKKNHEHDNACKGSVLSSKLTDFTNENTEFCTKMIPFYLKQFNSYSCSVASIAIVLNTILASLNKARAVNPIDQHDLIQRVRALNWRERVSMEGFEGKHGLTITELGIVVEATLNTFRIPFKQLKTVSIHKNIENLEEEKARLFSLLVKYCRNPDHYMIAHFTQGVYTGDWFGGHISPVGSFDPLRRRVLILDVDRDTEAPYWVPFDLFFEGLVGESKIMGPEGGGYVSIYL
ncbi:MAG: phytochelatin synthase family protein [Desulfobacterales bacterium]